jgi:ABC-type nitrate/sulfonate/bicarbonate transport system substrate-binding protein
MYLVSDRTEMNMCKLLTNRVSSHRHFVLLSTVFAVVLTAAAIVGNAAYAADPKVQIFSGTDEHWVPLQVAKAKGLFTAEGIDAEVTVFTTGATATEAFRAGRGDFISAGDLPSAAMWKTGNVIGIAPMSSDTEIFGIVGKSDISSPKDLRGRKVATRIGSTGEFLLYRYLASGNVAPSEVNIVDLAPPEMVLSLVHGNIDAFAWLAPFTTRAVSTGTNIKLIASAKGLANNRIILSVTKSLRDQKPELVMKALRAIHRAIEVTRTNPEEATQIWAKAVQGDVKQSLPVVRLISYDMKFDDSFINDMNELAKFMTQKGALKQPINWSMDVDITFLRQLDPALVTARSLPK